MRPSRATPARAVGALVLLSSAVVWGVETALLDRQLGIFRGGFLAVQQLRGPGEITGFLAASLLIDLSLCGSLVLLGLWIGGRLRLGGLAAAAVALGLATGPSLVADVVQFQVARFLGDAAHLRTLFGLVKASPGEFLAVGAVGGGGVLFVLFALGLAAGLVVWGLHRWSRQTWVAPARFSRVAGVGCAAICLAAAVVAAANLANPRVGNLVGRKPAGTALVMAIRWVTDVDGDGAGWLSRPADPAPWDPAIAPYALDIPGNGIDEDGLAGDLPIEFKGWDDTFRPAPRFVRRPPFVLVVLESVRGDVLDARVGGREVTPVLNAMARRGRRVSRAYSLNGFTAESRFHIFTGSLGGPRSRTSLIDDFAANGYETAFFSAQDESFGGDLDVGFDRAMVRYDARSNPELRFSRFSTPGSIGLPATVVRDKVQGFLAGRDRGRPVFLTVNFQDTHFPYAHDGVPTVVSDVRVPASAIGPARAAELRLMYLNTVAHVDRTIGELVAAVQRAEGQEPAVVVVSDHGESLFEEGFLGHGYALNEAQTRVVLLSAGLNLTLEEPVTQLRLRTAIGCALSEPDDTCGAAEAASPSRWLQYIGRFERPASMGWLDPMCRLKFDVFTEDRDGCVEAFAPMVHTWEKAILLSRQQ